MSNRVFGFCYPIWIGTGCTMLMEVAQVIAMTIDPRGEGWLANWWLASGWHFFGALALIWVPMIGLSIRNVVKAAP